MTQASEQLAGRLARMIYTCERNADEWRHLEGAGPTNEQEAEQWDDVASFLRALTPPAGEASAAEPVAWLKSNAEKNLKRVDLFHFLDSWMCHEGGWTVTPLYAAPQSPAMEELPTGWKLVPVEPTLDMVYAASKAETRHVVDEYRRGGDDASLGFAGVYRAMIAASPSRNKDEPGA